MTNTTQDRIEQAFAPKSWGSDPPGAPARVHMAQTASDRLRDKTRELARVAVGLVPVPAAHNALVDMLHDFVVLCEHTLQAHLEALPEFKRDGFKHAVVHAPLRCSDPGEGLLRIFELQGEQAMRVNVRSDGSTEAQASEPEATGEARDSDGGTGAGEPGPAADPNG
jgi:hypothetical protein